MERQTDIQRERERDGEEGEQNKKSGNNKCVEWEEREAEHSSQGRVEAWWVAPMHQTMLMLREQTGSVGRGDGETPL